MPDRYDEEAKALLAVDPAEEEARALLAEPAAPAPGSPAFVASVDERFPQIAAARKAKRDARPKPLPSLGPAIVTAEGNEAAGFAEYQARETRPYRQALDYARRIDGMGPTQAMEMLGRGPEEHPERVDAYLRAKAAEFKNAAGQAGGATRAVRATEAFMGPFSPERVRKAVVGGQESRDRSYYDEVAAFQRDEDGFWANLLTEGVPGAAGAASRMIGAGKLVGTLPAAGVEGAAGAEPGERVPGALKMMGLVGGGMAGTRALAPAGSGVARTAAAATVAGTGAEVAVKALSGEPITAQGLAESALLNLGMAGPDIVAARRAGKRPPPTLEEAGDIKRRYVEQGGDPTKVASEARVEAAQRAVAAGADPEVALATEPVRAGPDGPEGPYRPVGEALSRGEIAPEAVPLVEAANEAGIATVSSGVRDGVPYVIGEAPNGEVVELQGARVPNTPPSMRAKPVPPVRGESLTTFVVRRGGISATGQAASDVQRLGKKGTGKSGLIRLDDTMPVEDMMQGARESGFDIPEDMSPSQFLDAVEMDATGRGRVVRPEDAGAESLAAGKRQDAEMQSRYDEYQQQSKLPDDFRTSVKNRVTNEERAARWQVREDGTFGGVEPMGEPGVFPNKEAAKEALGIVDANPLRPQELVAELIDKPRAPTPVETALLTIQRVNLHKARAQADAEGIAAQARGDTDTVAAAKERAERASNAFLELEMATKWSGTESGRSLQARKMEMAQDYSLLQMETRRRAENDYKPLTPEQVAETKALHDRVTAAEAKAAALEERLASVGAKRALGKTAVRARATSYGATNKGVTREAYEATKAAMRARLSQLNVGLDPAMLVDLAKMGAFHIEAGARGFARWSKAMTKDLGEKVQPHLRAIWAEANKQAPKVADETGLSEAGKIAELVMRGGVTNRDAVIDEVHSILKEARPETTRREVMDAISGYGKVKPLSADPVKAELRELKGQMQQLAKLADMAEGRAPLKSGPERQAPGDEQRRLIKEVNEAKRVGGYDVKDPASQLRSAQDAIKTRLTHDIADLDRQIAAGKREQTQRTKVADTPEVTALRARRDALKQILDALDPRVKPGRTEAQRIATAIKAVERGTKEYERRVKTGDLNPTKKVDEAFEARKQKMLAKAQAERETAKQAWNEALFRDKLKNRTRLQKAAAIPVEVSNAARAVMTSFDVSAVGRQGWMLALSHPLIAARAIPKMFRAMASKGSQAEIEAAIRQHPDYVSAKRDGVFFTEKGPTSLKNMEEAYQSRWAEHIPGVAASQRGYTTYLNKLRLDVYSALKGNLSRSATPTRAEGQAIANFVNVMSGRSSIGPSNSLVALNHAFFSPRYVISRFQALAAPFTGFRFGGGSLRTRGLFAKEYARMLGGLAIVYGLSKLAGADVEGDPRSSDFGKIRLGETRIDPLAGLSQAAVFASRFIWGEVKQGDGKVRETRPDDAFRFLRSKAAPIPGAVMDARFGKNMMGEKVTAGDAAAGLVTPMLFRDIYKEMRTNGVPEGAAKGMLEMFGISVSTYGKKAKK